MYARRWLVREILRGVMLFRHNIRSLLLMACLTMTLLITGGYINTFNDSVKQFRYLKNGAVDITAIEREAVNKLVIEQRDGSVNIVFQIPASSTLSKELREFQLAPRISAPDDPSTESAGSVAPNTSSAIGVKENNVAGNEHTSSKDETGDKTRVTVQDKINDAMSVKQNNTLNNNIPVTKYPLTIIENPYNIINSNICKGIENLSFIVLVHTATKHFGRRNAIRETWASSKLFRNHTIKIVFLLGLPKTDVTQALIQHEDVLHRDIVQGRFFDTYRNLTHKGVLGLRWVSEHCPHSKIVVKVDDDVFLNVFKLMDDVENTYSKQDRHIWCPVRWNGTSKIQRNTGKWKLDTDEFYNMTYYPYTYCNGYFAVMTGDIIHKLYDAAKVTPFFWIDDIYLFGMLANKVGNITYTEVSNLNLSEKQAIACFDSTNTTCPMLVANTHTDGVMDKLWYNALRQHKSLANKYIRKEIFDD